MKKTAIALAIMMFSGQVIYASAGNENAPKGHHGVKGHGMKSVIQYADLNGDGDISFQEFQRTQYRYFNYKFRQLDNNRDGVVTEREFMEYHRSKGDGLFRSMDLDHDGVITRGEREQAKSGMKSKHEGCMEHKAKN